MKGIITKILASAVILVTVLGYGTVSAESNLLYDNSVTETDKEEKSMTYVNLKGWLLWHSYSSYSEGDSKLYLRSPDGNVKEISGDFYHAMNGSFGISPAQFTFMAIDGTADEWDIFISEKGTVTNLTKNSGFRNEDPKISPDGKTIVFKRGRWDRSIDDFKYDLAILDIASGEVKMLTDDITEEAMPCFSADGNSVYYAGYLNGIGSIMRTDLNTGQTDTVFSEDGVNAYYPVVHGEKLYFTRWFSADNHHDQLVCCDGNEFITCQFNSEYYDCSDACPAGDNSMIFSSTMNGDYDLYYYDGKKTVRPEINSGKNELGADYFPQIPGDVSCDGEFNISDLVQFQKYLTDEPDANPADLKAADFNDDGQTNVLDFCVMKEKYYEIK